MLEGEGEALNPLSGETCMSGGESKNYRIGLDRVIRRLILDRERWRERKRRARRPAVAVRPPDAGNPPQAV
jgi:hypothetical protein